MIDIQNQDVIKSKARFTEAQGQEILGQPF